MTYFDDLGQTILRAWSAADLDEQVFPALAAEHLDARPPWQHTDLDQLLDWVASADRLPRQHSLGSAFGQPPLVVYSHPQFYIEALCWTTSTTSIHHHGIAGAFTLLEGSSIETEYHFAERRRISSALRIGDTAVTAVRLLRRGQVRPIRPGAGFIHSVFHLDLPSVSIVVRTYPYREAGPVLDYAPPHVAEDMFLVDDNMKRRVQMLGLARQVRPDQYLARAVATVQRWDFHTAYHVLRQELHAADPWALPALVAAAIDRHGAEMALAITSLHARARQLRLIALRQQVTDADLRFFLACLISLDDRDAVFRIVAQRHPDGDPAALALGWLHRLADAGVVGFVRDDVNDFLIRELLAGTRSSDLPAALARDYDADDVAALSGEVIEQDRRLRALPALRALASP
jgi:hypothetical protein